MMYPLEEQIKTRKIWKKHSAAWEEQTAGPVVYGGIKMNKFTQLKRTDKL